MLSEAWAQMNRLLNGANSAKTSKSSQHTPRQSWDTVSRRCCVQWYCTTLEGPSKVIDVHANSKNPSRWQSRVLRKGCLFLMSHILYELPGDKSFLLEALGCHTAHR